MRRSLLLSFLTLSTGFVHGYYVFTSTPRKSPRTLGSRVVAVSASGTNNEKDHLSTSSITNVTMMTRFTGIKREIDWGQPCSKKNSLIVPLRNEVALLESGVLCRRGEFCLLSGERLQEVREKCETVGMTLAQGLTIRNQLLVTKVVGSSWKLEKQLDSIQRKFSNQQTSLLQLSKELDLPPVSILRSIVKQRVYEAYPEMLKRDRKRIVKSVINEEDQQQVLDFLTEWEIQELQTAKLSDVVGYTKVRYHVASSIWEQALYSFLDQQQINYVTEDAMREAGMQITPDCLLLDDCAINGQRVRWIDAKNFYASGLKQNWHFAKALNKQIMKYESAYGESGAVIYKHGFSQEVDRNHPYTLFLDAGPLVDLLET